MGNRLDKLMSAVNLREVMATETEEKLAAVQTIVEPIISRSNDFHEREIVKEIEEEQEEGVEEEEPYDAEKNARSVVYGLQALDSLILVPIATYKVKKRAGGSKAIKAMQAAKVKQMQGEELTDTDKRILEASKVYMKELEMLQVDFIPNQHTTEELIRLAMPWCEDNKIKFGSGMAFWARYAGLKVEQITKILLK